MGSLATEVMVAERRQQPREAASEPEPKRARAERHSRSVLLHGYGGATLRIFGTYQVDDDGQPRKIVVRAYHRESPKADAEPSDPVVLSDLSDLEAEIADWEVRATAIGWKRLSRRRVAGVFTKDELPAPPAPPKVKPGTFTKGGLPDPLSVKHGGGRGTGRR